VGREGGRDLYSENVNNRWKRGSVTEKEQLQSMRPETLLLNTLVPCCCCYCCCYCCCWCRRRRVFCCSWCCRSYCCSNNVSMRRTNFIILQECVALVDTLVNVFLHA
jgi:hypothetical protein